MKRLEASELQVLNVIANHVHEVSTAKGFHDPDLEVQGFARYTSNLHGEISELWEAYRKGQLNEPCDKAEEMKSYGLPVLTSIEEELADIVIRALETARIHDVDMARAVAIKDAFNQERPHRHGGKKA